MISIGPKDKKRGRPPKGTDPIVGIRMPPKLRLQIEAWAFRQADSPTLSAAIRRLVERALAGSRKSLAIDVRRANAPKMDSETPAPADANDAPRRSPRRSDRWRVRRPRRVRGLPDPS